MTSAFSWQNSVSLLCSILYSKTQPACYSRNLLTSCFCISVPYDEKDIFFGGLQFQKVLQVFIELFNISSSTLVVGAQTWITVILNSVDQRSLNHLEMNRDHFVVFEIAPKYYILDSFVDYEGYSISSKKLLPTVVDIMLI